MTHLLTILKYGELIAAVIFGLEHTIQNELTDTNEHLIVRIISVEAYVRPPDSAWLYLINRREEEHLTAEALPILFLYPVTAYQNQCCGLDYLIQEIAFGELIVLTMKMLSVGYLDRKSVV